MDYYSYRLEEIPIRWGIFRQEASAFLRKQGLQLDQSLEKYYGVFKGERLVGGAGYSGNVIKCVTVDPDYRGEGIVNALVSQIVTHLYQKGNHNIFLFTKPENAILFESLNFSLVEGTDKVLLLESDKFAFTRYLEALSPLQKPGKTAAIVMNCNPFTLGHQFLIETASARCDNLLVLAVEEDVSAFPFPVRLALMREGTVHLPNVTVIPGGAYVISLATFPTYFIKEDDDIVKAHAQLDVQIFGKHIAPTAGITLRFAGEEPLSPVTALYNDAMQRYLPPLGVGVEIVPRKQWGDRAISASRVRSLLAQDLLTQAKELVPETTYQYLSSPEAASVLEKLRAANDA